MKKLLAILLTLALSLSFTAALADTVTIGVPNDTTNEARALLLLQANGIIKLAMGSGIQATPTMLKSLRSKPLSCPFSCPIWTTPSSTPTTPSALI